jgi:CelD/BcsL family acetyltransferase involved in cellulose biosynthesis
MPLEMKEEISNTFASHAQVSAARSATAPAAQERMPADGFTILHAYPSPVLEGKWTECLQHTTAPAHYASPAFFLEPYFRGKKPFAVLALVGGEVVGVLTGLHEPGKVVSGLETRVHIAMDERRDPNEALELLVQGVNQESKGVALAQVYSWRQLPLTPFVKAGYRKREFMGNPILDLSLGAEALIAKCGKSQRRNIRFSAKNGVEIIEGKTREEFEAFYTIYERWSSVKQLAQYSKEMEWEAFQTTQKNRCLFLARHEGRIIAGSFVRFYPGGLVECSRNFSLPEFLYLKPNDLLIGHTIEWACKRGFRLISLGAHHKFLRGFGGEITPIDRYRKDRTLLRRYDLTDFVMDRSRAALHSLPAGTEEKVRKILRREKPAGW